MGAFTTDFPVEFCDWICDIMFTWPWSSNCNTACVKFSVYVTLLVSYKTIKYEPQLYDLYIDTSEQLYIN